MGDFKVGDPVAKDLLDDFPTLVTRFNRIGWTVSEGGCWIWNGSKHIRGGYGQIAGNRESGPLKTHRVAYELAKGPIPPGELVCHTCDNPPCINPDHLFTGTALDNTRDMWAKGRGLHMVMAGEGTPRRRLTWEQVQEIRQSSESGVVLGDRHGVSRSTISKVRLGKIWNAQHVYKMTR